MAISMNMKKFENILKELPQDKQPMASVLFEEMEFMKKSMDELKELVLEQGTIQTFTQGNNSYPRENPALTAYNKTMGRYNQTHKQLMDILPKEQQEQVEDELLEFIK